MRTGNFPIMHTLVVRDPILAEHPWVAQSLYDAWQESKMRCYEWLAFQRVHQSSLWLRAEWEEERRVAGDDPYAWGFKRTRDEVGRMLAVAFEQGFTPRLYQPEEMFFESMLDT